MTREEFLWDAVWTQQVSLVFHQCQKFRSDLELTACFSSGHLQISLIIKKNPTYVCLTQIYIQTHIEGYVLKLN